MTVPLCPKALPKNISDLVQELGTIWATSAICPRVSEGVMNAWSLLLQEWVADKDLPLLIRKSSLVRGKELIHTLSGRKIIPTDNAPAQWACNLALRGITPTLTQIRNDFVIDHIPVSFAHKANEKILRKYHCTLGKYSINKAGWKLCHIKSVGLATRADLVDIDISKLEQAFIDLLNPSNYFLLPISWGGLGETREFIDGFIIK